jgi:hypothetical protein
MEMRGRKTSSTLDWNADSDFQRKSFASDSVGKKGHITTSKTSRSDRDNTKERM